MRVLLLLVLYVSLHGARSDSHQENIEILMDRVLVLRVPHAPGSRFYVPLTCLEDYQNQPVFWRKNGKASPALHGNQVSVLVEEMDAGKYTCHLTSDESYLNHTLVLVQLDPDNIKVILEKTKHGHHGKESHIHCSGLNYSGSFHCTWKRTHTRSKAAVLLVKAERNSEDITCELDADGSGVHCQDPSCPYKEEQHRISLTVYIHSDSRLEAYTNSFYLREIVRPERLPNLRKTEGGVFSWDYPDSWDKPCTFFGLQFEVKLVGRGEACHSNKITTSTETPDIIEETNYTVSVKRKKFVFCVRARDKHTQGPWSDWSNICEYDT